MADKSGVRIGRAMHLQGEVFTGVGYWPGQGGTISRMKMSLVLLLLFVPAKATSLPSPA